MKIKLLTILFTALSLIACGGSGGDSSVEVSNSDVNGIWSGTFNGDGVAGVIHNGNIYLVDSYGSIITTGTVSVAGEQLTSSLNVYEYGLVGAIDTLALTGAIVEGTSITGTYSTNYNGSGNFSLFYDSLYDMSSSLSSLQGTWIKSSGIQTATVTIDIGGAFTGVDSFGCLYEGALTILDPSKNLYGVTFDITGCGSYSASGYAVLRDSNTLSIIYDDDLGSFASAGAFDRQ